MQAFWNLCIKFIADYLVIPIVAIGAWAMLTPLKPLDWKHLGKAVLAGGVALALALLASLFYQDKRPFLAQGVAAKASYLVNISFPSLHVLLVFTVTAIVWAATKRLKVSLLLLVLSVTVAVGRIVALVHSPADVLGGIGCALAATLLVYGRSLLPARHKNL